MAFKSQWFDPAYLYHTKGIRIPGFATAGVAVYRNVFSLIVEIDGYEAEMRLQTKRATYAEIRAWVKKEYGLHVSNLAISWTKDCCGLDRGRPQLCGRPLRY